MDVIKYAAKLYAEDDVAGMLREQTAKMKRVPPNVAELEEVVKFLSDKPYAIATKREAETELDRARRAVPKIDKIEVVIGAKVHGRELVILLPVSRFDAEAAEGSLVAHCEKVLGTPEKMNDFAGLLRLEYNKDGDAETALQELRRSTEFLDRSGLRIRLIVGYQPSAGDYGHVKAREARIENPTLAEYKMPEPTKFTGYQGLKPRQKVLKYVEDHGEISSALAKELTGFESNSLDALMSSLASSGKLYRVSKGVYRKGSNSSAETSYGVEKSGESETYPVPSDDGDDPRDKKMRRVLNLLNGSPVGVNYLRTSYNMPMDELLRYQKEGKVTIDGGDANIMLGTVHITAIGKEILSGRK
ncbi:MAG: hypothetical protein HY513_01920 [Candidatus Aenigmarchaeota archaeon]|nr:hypothetical protein [Candidatus Aenigmarchaeota archaeon]